MTLRALSAGFLVFILAVILYGCPAKIPERGTPEWTHRLEAGEVFVEAVTVPGTDLKLGTAVGLADAPAEVVWEIFQDANQFSQFLYHVKDSREIKMSGPNRMFELLIEPPTEAQMVFNDIHFKCEVTETVDRDRKIWRGDYNAIEGNIKRVYGAWQLEPYKEDRTLVTFSAFNDFGYPSMLDAAVNFYTQQFLEHWSEDLRERLADPEVRLDLEQRAVVRQGRDPRDVAPVIQGLDDFIR